MWTQLAVFFRICGPTGNQPLTQNVLALALPIKNSGSVNCFTHGIKKEATESHGGMDLNQ